MAQEKQRTEISSDGIKRTLCKCGNVWTTSPDGICSECKCGNSKEGHIIKYTYVDEWANVSFGECIKCGYSPD